ERAHDPAPELVGQEDREVPDCEAHHHPGEHSHRAYLRPCRLFRGRRCLSRWRLGSSLRTRSSGVRSSPGSSFGAFGEVSRPRSATIAWNSDCETPSDGSSGVVIRRPERFVSSAGATSTGSPPGPAVAYAGTMPLFASAIRAWRAA